MYVSRSVLNKMSVSRNHQCISKFIEVYQSESCLWQIKFKDYHNREKKAAYLKLIEKLKEVELDAKKKRC